MDGWEPKCVVGNLKFPTFLVVQLSVTWLRGYTVTRLHGYAVTRLRSYAVMRMLLYV